MATTTIAPMPEMTFKRPKSSECFWIVAFLLMFIGMFLINGYGPGSGVRFTPPPPPKTMAYSLRRTGPYEIAKIFGRSPGCRDADMDLINTVNNEALRAGADPRLVASVIAQESSCNVLAVSPRGAIGIMQILPRSWKNQYDFTELNLFNPRTNIRIGSEILASLVHIYGEDEGLRRYQGLGPSAVPTYVAEIVSRKQVE